MPISSILDDVGTQKILVKFAKSHSLVYIFVSLTPTRDASYAPTRVGQF